MEYSTSRTRWSPIPNSRKGVTKWTSIWKRNNWRTVKGDPVRNQELWIELDEEFSRYQTEWAWTKSHANNGENNRLRRVVPAGGNDANH